MRGPKTFLEWKNDQMALDKEANGGTSLVRTRDWYHRHYGIYVHNFFEKVTMSKILRFKKTWSWRTDKSMNIADALEDAVVDAGNMTERGELESLRAELDKLRSIVGFMASQMTPESQRNLAKMLGLEEVEDGSEG